jgi:hypothetical protein
VAEAVGTGFTVREAQDTRYHRLVVVDGGGSRYLRFDSSFQSGMYIGQPFRTRFAYTDYLQLGLAYNPSAKNVLVVGLGGASAPKRVWRDFGDVRLTVVELDPAVVETAYKWFALPHDDRRPRRRRAPVPPAQRRPLRRDHARRVLRRRRAVPHDDARVRGAAA